MKRNRMKEALNISSKLMQNKIGLVDFCKLGLNL